MPEPRASLPKFRRPRGWRSWRTAALAWTLLALGLWAAVFRDYGMSWDENPHLQYGEAVRKYFAGELTLTGVGEAIVPKAEFYSPAFDYAAAAIAHTTGLDAMIAHHALGGLVWVAMFFPVCGLARRLGGSGAAWFAGAALLGIPPLIGHAFINPKDLPLASAVAWWMFAIVEVAAARRPGWRHAVALGLGFGAVLAVRPGAMFLGAMVLTVPLARGWSAWQSMAPKWMPMLVRSAVVIAAALPLAWGVMIVRWPQALAAPWSHPIAAMRLAADFDEMYRVLYRGQMWPSTELPVSYLAGYFLFTVPLGVLALAVLGHLGTAWRVRRSAGVLPAVAVTGFVLWFPLAYFLAVRPNIYDGMRHFLFVLPALAVWAGAGAMTLVRCVPGPRARIGVAMLATAAALAALPAAWRLHPYEQVYYNELAGDRATLHERFETDYWVTSYREAAAWIGAEQRRRGRPVNVLLAARGFAKSAFTRFCNRDVRVQTGYGDVPNEPLPENVDFYVATVRHAQWKNFSSAPIVHRVERDGVLLCVIRAAKPVTP